MDSPNLFRSCYKGQITRRTHTISGKVSVEKVLPIESVEEYFEHFPVLEIDYSFYRLLLEKDGKPLGIETAHHSWKELWHTTVSLMHLKGVPPLAIKNQLRHTTVKTTENFHIGLDIENQRKQIEKLVLNQKIPEA